MARCLSSSCLCPPDRVTLRISNWVDPSNPVFELWVLHVLTVPLGGALTPQTQPLSSQSCPCVPHSSPRRTPSQLMTHPLSSPGVLVALCYLLVDKDTRARLRWTNFKVRTDLCAWEWSGGEGLQGCVHPPLLAPPHPRRHFTAGGEVRRARSQSTTSNSRSTIGLRRAAAASHGPRGPHDPILKSQFSQNP